MNMVSCLHKYRQNGHPSVGALMDTIPDDGCLLVFNAHHRSWRTKASELGLFTVFKWSSAVVGRDSTATCDLYITWREE